MKRIILIGVIAGVLAVAAFALSGARHAEGPSQGGAHAAGAHEPRAGGSERPAGTQPVAVLAAEAVQRAMRQELAVTGSLRTDEDVQIGSRIAGKVVEVPVKEGDRVRRGQVLVRLDDRELQAQLARAQGVLAANRAKLSLARNQATWKDTASQQEHQRALANLSAARSRLQQAETNAKLVETQTRLAVETAQSGVRVATERLSITREVTRKQELRQAQLAVEQAVAHAEQARVDTENARQMLERRQTLYRQDAIAREEVDEAERRHKAFQAQQRSAEAAVAVAQQKLELAQEGSRPEEVRIGEGQLAAAERALTQAKSDLGKQQVAQDEVATAKAAVQQAEAAVKAAQAGLVQTEMSVDDIRAAEAAMAQAQADIQVYRTQLSDLVIRAPVTGVVATRQVNAGEMVTTSTPLMQLVALDAVYLEASVPELEVGQLRPGAPAQVTVDALPGRRFSGSVREVIPVADRSSRAFRVRIALPGGHGRLPAGGYARATVHVGSREGVVCIRKDALHTETGDRYVWLIEGDGEELSARRRIVTVGLVDDRFVEIRSGLKPGDRVVAAGSPAIIDGTPLTISDGPDAK